jgi:heme o synthase
LIKQNEKYSGQQTLPIEGYKPISLMQSFNLLLELVKIRITVLVSFTTALGYFLAAKSLSFGFVSPVLGIFLLACSSAALNQYQESDTDILMSRTLKRPIPSGRISGNSVLAISGMLLLTGSLILLIKSNVPALITGLVTFFWYNAVYTPLKKKTALAILPGSFVGALPPIAGWLAAGGNISDTRMIITAVYFFVWQIPHFWLLLLLYGEDFKKGGFPVLTEKYSVRFIKSITFVLLVATVLIAVMMPFSGIGYYGFTKILIMAFSLIMLVMSYRFVSKPELTRKDIVTTFMSINLYTLTLITILSVDKLFSLI